MTDPRHTLTARLKDISAVDALVDGRIWPHVPPQGQSKPYIVYRMIDSVPINHSDGTVNDDFARLQVDCCAATYDGAMALAAAVRGNGDDLNPTGVAAWEDDDERLWILESEQEDTEAFTAGTDRPSLYRIMQDYMV